MKEIENLKKTILITGSRGFIAEGFIEKYYSYYNLVGIDTKIEDRREKIIEYNVDVCETDLVMEIIKKHNVQYIIHTAAEKSLINCEYNKEYAYNLNYIATMKLANRSQKLGVKFIFISSDQVFDGKKGDYKENDNVNAINYYGQLKIMVEHELLKMRTCSICRTALVFGKIPKEQRGYFESIKKNEDLAVQGYIVQQTKACLETGVNINLPADEFVSPTHVNLLAKQIQSVIEKNVCGILHCCGNDYISRYEIGCKIAEKYNLDFKLINGENGTNPLRPKNVALNCKMTETKLGFEFPSFTQMLEDGEYE